VFWAIKQRHDWACKSGRESSPNLTAGKAPRQVKAYVYIAVNPFWHISLRDEELQLSERIESSQRQQHGQRHGSQGVLHRGTCHKCHAHHSVRGVQGAGDQETGKGGIAGDSPQFDISLVQLSPANRLQEASADEMGHIEVAAHRGAAKATETASWRNHRILDRFRCHAVGR